MHKYFIKLRRPQFNHSATDFTNNTIQTTLTPFHILLLFMLAQIIAWTLIATYLRGNLPFDTVESIAWGAEWQAGYDKHPPLAAWLSQLFVILGGNVSWPQYFLSELSVACCLLSVYFLAREIINERLAVCSALLLQSIYYYSVAALQFNPNVLMLSTWSLTALAFYHAFTDQSYRAWLAAGLLASFAMLAKYESALLLASLGIVLFFSEQGRTSWKNPAFYAGIVLFVLILLPNLYWLWQHHFMPFAYTLDRVTGPQNAVSHWLPTRLAFPLHFLLEQVGAILPLFLLILLFVKNRQTSSRTNTNSHAFAGFFLACLNVGPLLLTIFLSFSKNMWLHSLWGFPYFTWLGLGCLYLLNPVIDDKLWRQFLLAVVGVMILYLSSSAIYWHYGPFWLQRTNAAHFPGQRLANLVTEEWRQRYHQPLTIIAGAHVLVANIAAYSPDHPHPYFQWNSAHSPWITTPLLQKQGAVFVWDTTPNNHDLPTQIRDRFPEAVVESPLVLSPLTAARVKPIWIGVAFLPPHNHAITENQTVLDWSDDQ